MNLKLNKPMKILITGASGTGTSTLAKSLAEHYNINWFDLDDFYWYPLEPRFTYKRSIQEREALLIKAIVNSTAWVISGTLLYWGKLIWPLLDLTVFLTVPANCRLTRIITREINMFGMEMLFGNNGTRKKLFSNFLNWTKQYDTPTSNVNILHDNWSRKLHEEWLLKLNCPILHIDGEQSNTERLKLIIQQLQNINIKYIDIVQALTINN